MPLTHAGEPALWKSERASLPRQQEEWIMSFQFISLKKKKKGEKKTSKKKERKQKRKGLSVLLHNWCRLGLEQLHTVPRPAGAGSLQGTRHSPVLLWLHLYSLNLILLKWHSFWYVHEVVKLEKCAQYVLMKCKYHIIWAFKDVGELLAEVFDRVSV